MDAPVAFNGTGVNNWYDFGYETYIDEGVLGAGAADGCFSWRDYGADDDPETLDMGTFNEKHDAFDMDGDGVAATAEVAAASGIVAEEAEEVAGAEENGASDGDSDSSSSSSSSGGSSSSSSISGGSSSQKQLEGKKESSPSISVQRVPLCRGPGPESPPLEPCPWAKASCWEQGSSMWLEDLESE